MSNTKAQCLGASILCFEHVQQIAFDHTARRSIDGLHNRSPVQDLDLHLGKTMQTSLASQVGVFYMGQNRSKWSR